MRPGNSGGAADALAGHRLTANAPDRESLQASLAAGGANPLLTGAVRARRQESGTRGQEPGGLASKMRDCLDPES